MSQDERRDRPDGFAGGDRRGGAGRPRPRTGDRLPNREGSRSGAEREQPQPKDGARTPRPRNGGSNPSGSMTNGSGRGGATHHRGSDPRHSVRGGSGRGSTLPVPLLGPRRTGPAEPALPADVTGSELDRPVRALLRSLSKANAEMVARHLVMAGRLLADDPRAAYAHAMAAQRRAGRIAVVREAVGVAAYHAGLWAEALSELRAARRMSGSSHQLPLMADAERGLGRPERALDLAGSREAATLTTAERVELAIVVSGARLDLGQPSAAVLSLQIPELVAADTHAFTPRLRYAYAQALLAAGRRQEALSWFAGASEADLDDVTDADDRLADLQGLVFTDLADTPAQPEPGPGDA